MNLKILGKTYETPGYPVNYRGITRTQPFYVGEVSSDHEANQAFFWFIESSNDFGFLKDLVECQNLIRAYQRLPSPISFEIVEVTIDNAFPETKCEFLGFDLVYAYRYSLLEWGLEFDNMLTQVRPKDDLVEIMDPLFQLIKVFFQPKLNSNVLFDSYEVASFCLDCMMSLQKIRPNLWESDSCIFKVIGLWKVL